MPRWFVDIIRHRAERAYMARYMPTYRQVYANNNLTLLPFRITGGLDQRNIGVVALSGLPVCEARGGKRRGAQ